MLFDKFQTMADFQAELAERGVTPFTVPYVPTGMNTGVSTTP